MIKSFKHRGLKALYEDKATKSIAPKHLRKLTDILGFLDQSTCPQDMNLPGFGLHPLKGKLKGYYSVWVSGNWRVTFRFQDGDVYDVNYLDYH